MARARIWDLPTRLFHWSLVIAIVGAVAAEKAGRMDLHAGFGIAVLGLVAFRVAWGLVGARYARFSAFVAGPARIREYLQGRWHGAGHNPLGALSVLAMLGVAGLQASTGLFGNDDSTFFGPLYDLVSREASDQLTRLHRLNANLLVLLVVLHIAAILWYRRVRGQDLVRPMVTGWTDQAPEGTESTRGGGALALAVAVLVGLAAVYAASGDWIPEPPPPAETNTPPPSW